MSTWFWSFYRFNCRCFYRFNWLSTWFWSFYRFNCRCFYRFNWLSTWFWSFYRLNCRSFNRFSAHHFYLICSVEYFSICMFMQYFTIKSVCSGHNFLTIMTFHLNVIISYKSCRILFSCLFMRNNCCDNLWFCADLYDLWFSRFEYLSITIDFTLLTIVRHNLFSAIECSVCHKLCDNWFFNNLCRFHSGRMTLCIKMI